ncbi:DUF6578 domain-containing protein [Streptomyces adustus]|uniref:DUF6578 domain-containing protein n=1 Tax=Streptomyces adustus TaxID=1609272 RepID=UPI0037222D3D
MGLWHVFYPGWQLECCGTPFAVGDEVSWQLLLERADDLLDGRPGLLTEITGPVEELWDTEDTEDGDDGRDDGDPEDRGDGDDGDTDSYDGDGDDDGYVGSVQLLREDTGLTVALAQTLRQALGEVRTGDRVCAAGLLGVERHGARWPEVTGRVRAVHVVSRDYAETEPGARPWEPVPGRLRLRPVESCPRWFDDGEVRTGEDGRGRRRSEEGVLVTLEVPGTDSRLSRAVREARGIPHTGAAPGAETAGLTPEALRTLLEGLSTVSGSGPS